MPKRIVWEAARHGFDVRVAGTVHIEEEELPGSDLSFPFLPSTMKLGTTRTRRWPPTLRCPHPPPHPYHHGIPQPGTALALFSTHAPSGVVQHSMLLSIALACHSKGRFAEIEHKRIVSVSKKKNYLFNSCAVTAVTVSNLRTFFVI